MSIVVVGAGAIGLLVAGRLARAQQPTALLARPATGAAIREQGVRIQQDGRTDVVRGLELIGAPERPVQPGQRPDLAILCVKGYDTAGALPALEALNPRAILTLQNGIGNEETLAERFGAERVVSGAITISVETDGPGQITVTKSGGIGLASLTGEPAPARWATTLGSAGFLVREYADYRAMKWSKALLNMLGNATAAILDMPVDAIYADRRLAALERRAFLEALGVMRRMGLRPVNLPRYPAAWLALAMRTAPAWLLDPLLRQLIGGGRGGKPPSLQLDLARGSSRSEGEFLYGAVVRAGAQAGIATPANRALWETLRAILAGEVAWSAYQRNPERLLDAAR